MSSRIRAIAAAGGLLMLGRWTVGAADTDVYRSDVRQIMARQAGTSPAVRPAPRPALLAPRRDLASSPDSPRSATFPEGPPAAPTSSPAAARPEASRLGALTSFLGAELSDSDAFPPDSMGAAGPSQFLVGVNGRLRSFSKETSAPDGVLDVDLDVFFVVVRDFSPTGTPRVRYDRLSSRWVVTALTFTASNNRVLIALTDAASAGVISPATVWTFFYFQHHLDSPAGDADTFLDSASLGIDANALVIGGNLFDTAGQFRGTSVHAVRKSDLLTGSGGNLAPGGTAVAYRNLTTTPTGIGPYSPQGVDNLQSATAPLSWIVGVNNAGFGKLVFRKLTYGLPNVWPPTISGNLQLTVPSTAFPLSVPHLENLAGTPGELDALDDRLFAASLRAGSIWTAHNVSVDGTGTSPGDRDGSRWYQVGVSSGTPVLFQSGTLYDPSATNPHFYWTPAIAVSGQGRAAIGTSAAGAADHANAAVAERFSGDPAGSLQDPALATAAADAYNPPGDPGAPRRWGSYSYTSVDPEDDMTLWTVQEYCNAADSWGVRVVRIAAPPPAVPALAAPASVASGLASVPVTLTGTSNSGTGFFDPGPGFPRRIQVSLSLDVTVNAVTYNSPISLTLDLNTVDALPGVRSITVINPDGQAAEGPGLLTITGGAVTVLGVTPASGPAAGGFSADLSGSGFAVGATVKIGSADSPLVTVTSGSTATVTVPALSPGTLNDVTLTNADARFDTLPAGWFADFLDVDQADIFHADVEKLLRNAVTAGCGTGNYCRNGAVTRGQMAVFLLKAKLGPAYAPPTCAGTIFDDVPCTGGNFDAWIEDLAARGITGGCGGESYCPASPVTRAQMAALLLKTALPGGYVPPACAGTVFLDVPCTGGNFDPWIEDLAARGITGGCGGGNYCPGSSVTRGQMAAFLVKAFLLP